MKSIKISEKVKAVVGENGQVTIPISIRKQYKIERGDMVVFEVKECVVEEEE